MKPRVPRKRTYADATGKPKGERVSEYFDFVTWPEKADRKVTRVELLALMTRWRLVERESRWYRVLWRWLKAKSGSTPTPIGGGEATDGD